jgi:hypothetical protein
VKSKFLGVAFVLITSFVVAACDQTKGNPPASDQAPVEIEFDFDTKTKTVTVPTLTPPPYRPATTVAKPKSTR